MRKRYEELDLKKIRETAGLNFAHFTYKKGMCSCCYGPKDLPAKYWTGGEEGKKKAVDGDYSYILFKNADNGSGAVRKTDEIRGTNYIEWNLDDEQLDTVVEMLKEQLGDGYEVVKPKDDYYCITVKCLEDVA